MPALNFFVSFSVITDLSQYAWKDEAWLKQRKNADSKKAPMSIYEVHLGSFRKPEDGREFYNYRELAVDSSAIIRTPGSFCLKMELR